MAHINVQKTPKAELVWMSKHRCKHHMTYLEHQNCYLRDHPNTEKLGFLDIETSNLHASFGIVLCYCIKEGGTDTIYNSVITAKELTTCLDYHVLKQCIEDMKRFDRIITYYGSKFDIPFLRTRAIASGLEFPEYGDLVHNDIYYAARYKLRLHSNRLEQVGRTLFGKTEKNHIEPDKWIKALMGNEEALGYILDHCKRDVRELEKVYNSLFHFVRGNKTSI